MIDKSARSDTDSPRPPSDESLESLLGEVAGDYFDRMAGGECPQLDDYVSRYPEIAEQIRCAFPALQVVGDSHGQSLGRHADIDLSGRKTLGDFRILRELGRGGMGVVYEAEQLSMGRKVALKVLPFAALAHEKSLQRFRNEVRAAGTLNHPSIVPIYSVGEDRGIHFFAMQLISGQTMAEVIAQIVKLQTAGDPISQAVSVSEMPKIERSEDRTDGESDSRAGIDEHATPRDTPAKISTEGHAESRSSFVRSAARLGVQAAEALQHAHDRGVLHRDIKPGNLMLDAHGQIFIADFGLAHVESDVGVTMTGDVVGTLRYMSPEQALGKRIGIDHRSDIYSLGVTLYELLTLRPPFDGSSREELLKQIAFEDPPKPRQISRSIPHELETIVCKATEKDPEERYATAGELANDLQAFLEDRPIMARPATLFQRSAKWTRRHKPIVVSAVAVLMLATVSLAVTTAIVLSQKAQTARALETAENNFSTSELHRRQAEQAVDVTETLLYVRNLSLAARAYSDGDMRRAADLMRTSPAFEDRPELRGFEWHYLRRLVIQKHDFLAEVEGEIFDASYSPDGSQIAIAVEGGQIELWDTSTRRRSQVLRGHTGQITRIDFHPSGEQLASASHDGTVRVWSLSATDDVTIVPANPGGATFDVRFSPDGTALATGGDDDLVKLWSVSPMEKMADLAGHTADVRCLVFLVDGKTVASGSDDGTIKLWDVRSASELDTLHGHSDWVLSLTTEPRGKLLISGCHDATIRVWDLDRRRCISSVHGHFDAVQALAFDGGRKRLVSGDRGGTVRTWNLAKVIESSPVIDRYVADESVVSVALAPDGADWAALQRSGQLVMGDVKSGQTQSLATHIDYPPYFPVPNNLAFSSDGQRIACLTGIYVRGSNGRWQVENLFTLPSGLFFGHVSSLAFSSDADTLAMGAKDSVMLWDVETGRQLANSTVAGIKSLQFSSDDSLVAIGAQDGRLVLWDWHANSLTSLIGHSGDVHHVGFIGDGRQLASFSGSDQTVRWWDLTTEKETRRHHFRGNCRDVALSNDQSFLASTDTDGSLSIWDVRGDRLSLRVELRGRHGDRVDSVQFSELGTELITGTLDDDVVVWDFNKILRHEDANGEYLQGHTDRVWAIDVIDGQQILTAGRDGSARIWIPPQTESTFHFDSDGRHVLDFQFISDGTTLASLSESGIDFFDSRSGDYLSSHQHRAETNPLSFSITANEQMFAVGCRGGNVVLHREAAGSTMEFAASQDDVDQLVFSPDGTSLVTANDAENHARVWDSMTGAMLAEFDVTEDSLEFSPDGKTLACVDYSDCVMVSTDTWQEVFRMNGHSMTISDVAFNSLGTLLATSSHDRRIIIWETASCTPRNEIDAHTSRVESIAFSPDGRTLASGAKDGTIKLWNVELGQELFELEKQPASVVKLVFAPDGTRLFGQLDNGRMTVFDIHQQPSPK